MSKTTRAILRQQETRSDALVDMQRELSRLTEEWNKDEPPPEPTQADVEFYNSLDKIGF